MGRPSQNGAPAFRFTQNEVMEMESCLRDANNGMPAREVLVMLAEKFSASSERSGKVVVQTKQVWNWFQNRRYAQRAKSARPPAKLSITPHPRDDSLSSRNIPHPVPVVTGRSVADGSQMEFEAKSARDGAWYDVATFVSHRMFETGDPEVCVRFTGFGSEEDEWINVKKHVRQRSLPCEAAECVVVLPGDLILCFQEGKEQALYFDAHVLDVQRRRHDVRGCRCRFLVRYDHDQSEEIVPLRKVCRRPETDYRLQLLHSSKNLSMMELRTTTHHSKESPLLGSRELNSNVPKPKKQDKPMETLVEGSAASKAEKDPSAVENAAPIASEKELTDCEESVAGDSILPVDGQYKT